MKTELPYSAEMNIQNTAIGYSDLNGPVMRPQPVNQAIPNSLQFNNVLEQGVQIKPQQVLNPNAIQEYVEKTIQPPASFPSVPMEQPPARRNLTVAEMLVFLVVAMIAVEGVKTVWNFAPKPIISIEWRR